MKTNALVDLIHKTPTTAVVISTGGGTDIFPTLLRRGGGSATLISGIIPYGMEESIALMGGKPDKLVSESAVRTLAMAAFQRALKYRSDPNSPVIGVATSSILQKTPEERSGRVHYIYTALQTKYQTISQALVIPNAVEFIRSSAWATFFSPRPETIRVTEEEVNSQMLLNLIAEGCGLSDRVKLKCYADRLIERQASGLHKYSRYIGDLITGKIDRLAFDCYASGKIECVASKEDMNPRHVRYGNIFPGSFNPVHYGHKEMVSLANKMVYIHRYNTDYEISLRNAAKPNLDLLGLEERLMGFTGRMWSMCSILDHALPVRVWVTNAPTFVEKAKLFPEREFVMGYDTAERVNDPKYGDVDAVMKEFEKYDTRFLVFGRDMGSGYQKDLSRFHETFQKRARLVDEKTFQQNISSSEIRDRQNSIIERSKRSGSGG